ncbi:unnamed protein product [Phaeothamnion confervicola]
MRADGAMEQGSHRAFLLRAEKTTDRDRWVAAIRSETQAVSANVGSASGAAGAAGAGNGRSRPRRRASFEQALPVKVPPPTLRGWARTQHDRYSHWSRRYCALFRGVGEDGKGNVLYFFGSAEMVERMVGQRLHTYHGSLSLETVTEIQLRRTNTEHDKMLVLMVGTKRWVLTLEDQKAFRQWVVAVTECCPQCPAPVVRDEDGDDDEAPDAGSPVTIRTSAAGSTCHSPGNSVGSASGISGGGGGGGGGGGSKRRNSLKAALGLGAAGLAAALSPSRQSSSAALTGGGIGSGGDGGNGSIGRGSGGDAGKLGAATPPP